MPLRENFCVSVFYQENKLSEFKEHFITVSSVTLTTLYEVWGTCPDLSQVHKIKQVVNQNSFMTEIQRGAGNIPQRFQSIST